VQTCTRCHAQSSDDDILCVNCQAVLAEWSETAVALRELQANSRVLAIRIFSHDDCCPACREYFGTYEKDKVPALPVQGCSNEDGCRCFYSPFLDTLYP
jgi:hypothetical protein